MAKKIKMQLRAMKHCKDKSCRRGECIGVHADDYVNTQITVETRGVAHPTVKFHRRRKEGHEGVALGPGNLIRLGTRKKK